MAVKGTPASPDPGQPLPTGKADKNAAIPLKYYPRYFQGPAPMPRRKSRPQPPSCCQFCRCR